jgi:hypothetical protein
VSKTLSTQQKNLMNLVKRTATGFFADLHGDAATAVEDAVPDIAERKAYPIVGPNVVGVFYVTLPQGQRANRFQTQGLGPFPALLTTRPDVHVAINVEAPNFFFGGNRAEGLVLRISPAGSVTVWRHVQVFTHKGKTLTYRVDLAFVLGTEDNEATQNIQSRLLALLQHTVTLWEDMDWSTSPDER